ncbi:MAG: serine/threonine-protein phosphatase [Phycisphaerae bacterium]|nr:serine/threonine-protein phosphatase [Phycisphaerae bacterium]
MAPIIHVALLGAKTTRPGVLNELIDAADWCVCEHVELSNEDRPSAFRRFDVAVVADKGIARPRHAESRSAEQDRQLELLQRFSMGVLILSSRPWLFAGFGAGVVCLPPDASVDMIHGVLLALHRSRPVLRQIDKQVTNLNRLSQTLRREFEATDRELRLASRLQHDFLPRELPKDGPIRFVTLFRPCTWVSGDIFDIFRLDERHWGFYIADAVGHGVAAGLLTMYIKHAIRPKRIIENGYELVAPSEVMGMLNDQLAFQELPDSQFITGWYGLINTDTLELRYAVAGHPPPMLIDADGGIRELHADGCLLGLCGGQRFSDESVVLRPGERVMLYSDGLEGTLIARRPPLPQMPELMPGVAELLRLPAGDVINRLRDCLDSEPGSLSRADDVTVVLLDLVGGEGEAGR